MSLEDLRKAGWYLGEVDQEGAISVLRATDVPNVFVVYSSPDSDKYTLSVRFASEENIIDHLPISCTEEGKYQISGHAGVYDGIIEAVNGYIQSTSPPLVPALHGKHFETQLSLTDAPPDYDNAQRVLKPDIAPLPDVASVHVDAVTEAKEGHVSPTSSMRRNDPLSYIAYGSSNVSYVNRNHWHYYQYHGAWHPKNVCHYCCHRPTYWNGHREVPIKKWWNPVGSGPLRFIGVLLFWLLCGLCIGCGALCWLCCVCISYLCCYHFYDDD